MLNGSWISGKTILVTLAGAVQLAGCSHGPSTGASTAWKNHVIIADKEGKAQNKFFNDERCDPRVIARGYSDEIAAKNYEEECQVDRVLEHFDFYEAYIKKHGGRIRPLAFIHGGLNSNETSILRANKDIERLCGDEYLSGDEEVCQNGTEIYFPVFLNWHSGFWSSWWDQVALIRGGRRIKLDDPRGAMEAAFTPFYIISDALRTIANAPASWAYQLVRFYDKFQDDEVQVRKDRYGNQRWSEVNKTNNVIYNFDAGPESGNIREEVTDPEQLGENAAFVASSPFKTLTTPMADVLGDRAWQNMQRRTKAVFWTQEDFDREEADTSDNEDAGKVDDEGGSGVFARFLRRFQRDICSEIENEICIQHEKGVGDVTLVAHSMGAIIANDIIRHFDLGFDRIVYMGAAASTRDAHGAIVPYLLRRNRCPEADEAKSGEEYGGTKFYNLMLHPEGDAWEESYYVVPSGSLLEWIDNMYEDADSDFDLTMGKWANIERAKSIFPAEAQRHMIFKVFGQEGGGPTEHGRFDDLEYWTLKYWGSAQLGDGSEETRCREEQMQRTAQAGARRG